MDNGKQIFGVIVLLLGITLLFDQLFPGSVSIFATFWPVILMVIGINLLQKGNTTGGYFLLIIGTIFLLSSLFSYNFISILWPLLIIAFGVRLLSKQPMDSRMFISSGDVHDDKIDETYILSGAEKTFTSEKFMGGEITTILGGGKLDLSQVKLGADVVELEVTSILGGFEIIAPKTARVELSGTPILAGWQNSVGERAAKAKLLRIKATAILGGFEVK